MVIGKKYKIKWIDIQSYAEWTTRETVLNFKPLIIDAVYIYIGKGKGGLCFAGEEQGGEYGNISIIPRGNIKKLTLIK